MQCRSMLPREPEPQPSARVEDGTAGSISLPRSTAVIVAAGRGSRLGAPDKVLLPLAGQPMLAHVLQTVSRARCVDSVVLVIGEHTRVPAEVLVQAGDWPQPVTIVVGGERRQDSVAAGVEMVPPDADVIILHDAARPLADPDLFDRCAVAAAIAGAAIAAVPVADTLKRVESDRVIGTVSREAVWAAQTPQAFRRELLVEALRNPVARTATFTDEAGLFEALGLTVAVVPGSARNLKVTRAADVDLAEALLAQRCPGGDRPFRAAGAARAGAAQ